MKLSRRHILALSALVPIHVFAQATLADQIAPYESIEVGDIEIAYRVVGSGDPLLMIMGFSGTMDTWDPTFIAALASRFQVITSDNRGIGGTDSSGPYPFSQMADDAAELVHALGFDKLDVFGWSLGSMIAADLAIRHSDVVRNVVLHAGDAGGSDSVTASPDVLQDFFNAARRGEGGMEPEVDFLLPADWVEANRAYVNKIFSRPLAPVSTEGVLLQARTLVDWYGESHGVASITAPTMIVHGIEDLIIPVANAQLLADAIPGSWLIRMPGGHGLQYQVPGQLAGLVDLFVHAGA